MTRALRRAIYRLGMTTAFCSGSLAFAVAPVAAQETASTVDPDRADDTNAARSTDGGEVTLPQIDVRESIGSADDTTGFATVSVASGTRTQTPITSIPRSVSVISQEVLKTQQPQTLSEALRNAPGVSIFEQSGRSDIFIRGFAATSLLTNGYSEPPFLNRPLASVERLEVLKGPASILVGAEAAGGILNVILKKPTDTALFDFTAHYGSREYARGEVDVGGPLTTDGRLKVRVTGSASRSDRNFAGYDGERKYSISPVVSAEMGPLNVIVGLEHYYDRTPSTPYTSLALSAAAVAAAGFPSFAQYSATHPGTPAAVQAGYGTLLKDLFLKPIYTKPQVFGNAGANAKNRSLRGYYEATLRLGELAGIDLTLRSRGQSLSQQNTSKTFFPFDVGVDNRRQLTSSASRFDYSFDTLQNDLVAKFRTGPIAHTILTGYDYQLQNRRTKTGPSAGPLVPFPNVPDTLPLPGGPVNLSGTGHLSQTGILLQDQLDIADRLHVLLSMRLGRFKQLTKTYNRVTGALRLTIPSDFKRTGYNLGATYDITDWLTPYASYSRGYQPTIGGITRAGQALPPIISTQAEIGVKSLLMDDKLTVTLAAFDIKTQNLPTPDFNPATDQFSQFAFAGDGQRSKGVEFELAGAITPNWNLLLSGAYNDTVGTQGLRAAGSGSDVTITVPKYTGNLWTTYDIKSGPLSGLGFGLGEYYFSKSFGGNLRVPSYKLTKLSLFYTINETIKFAATVDNALNEKYFQPAQSSGYVPYGAPRSFLLSANISLR